MTAGFLGHSHLPACYKRQGIGNRRVIHLDLGSDNGLELLTIRCTTKWSYDGVCVDLA